MSRGQTEKREDVIQTVYLTHQPDIVKTSDLKRLTREYYSKMYKTRDKGHNGHEPSV